MHSTLTAPERRTQHPPQPGAHLAEAHHPVSPRPVRPLDRLALRVGLALITWGRRTTRSRISRERLVRRHELLLLREQRERHALREALLTLPLR